MSRSNAEDIPRVSLRDLVEVEALRYPLRKVWIWALNAGARDELPGMPPDTSLHPIMRSRMSATAAAVERGSDPSGYQWIKTIMLDAVAFSTGVERAFGTRCAAPPRKAGRTPTAGVSYIRRQYPNGPPAGIPYKVIQDEIERKTGQRLSLRTIARTFGRK